jgi:hypothetical protein
MSSRSAGVLPAAWRSPRQTELERVTGTVQQAGIETQPTRDGKLLFDPARNGVVWMVEPAARLQLS